MTQRELCEAVSQATGESLRAIRQRGFSLVSLQRRGPDSDPPDIGPQIVDWDQLEHDRLACAVPA